MTATAAHYWEERAQRFARAGNGLAAVCSYGMPRFYNQAIEVAQRRALTPWLRVPAGTRVLDVGCGIGRWARALATRGAVVTGVDLSPTMVAEAERRAREDGVSGQCTFAVADLATLALDGEFDLVVGVTVLQHILDRERLALAVGNIARHLAADGTAVLLEAAPSDPMSDCDTPVFEARPEHFYRTLFADCGLHVQATAGVDPAPFRPRFLTRYRHLPRWAGIAGLAAVTAVSLPIDLVLARALTHASWHKVFVLSPRGT